MPILGILDSAKSGNLVPNAPTIGTATNTPSGRPYNNGAASVTFTPAASGPTASTFTVTSSPSGYSATGGSSPITVTGLQSNTAYTFTVVANSAGGSSLASSASNSITATTVPQAPTMGAVSRSSNTQVSVPYTDNATGGAGITSRTITSSPSLSLSYSTTGSSPIAVTASFVGNQAYTFTITATNANGTSAASGASNSVTPYVLITPVVTGLTFASTGSTTGQLTWTGTNIDSVLFAASPNGASLYPPPYNYGAFTGGWTGNLINLVSGQTYNATITPASSTNTIGASYPITFTQP
jgi:hypothetical protein